jgi:hypothetical protein
MWPTSKFDPSAPTTRSGARDRNESHIIHARPAVEGTPEDAERQRQSSSSSLVRTGKPEKRATVHIPPPSK